MPADDGASPDREAPPRPAAGGWRPAARWGLVLLLLLFCVLLELTGPPPDGPAPALAVTMTFTLAIQRDIEAMLDGYGPLLRADTPLLQRPYHARGQAANDPELWVLPDTAGKVGTACAQVLYHSHNYQPSLEDACWRLMRNLTPAAEAHRRVARSLAGPHTEGLWLSHVEAPLLGLLWSLDNLEAAPRYLNISRLDGDGPQHATIAADGGDDSEMEVTAMLMRGYVNSQRDPQRSTNSEIRRALLPLHEKCTSIAADIRLISGHDASDGASGWAELLPLAGQVEQLVSAAADILDALDAVDNALLGLAQWLERMPRGYFEVDEAVGEAVVRNRFKLPPPAVISQSISARLARMREDTSALQRGWVAPRRLATAGAQCPQAIAAGTP